MNIENGKIYRILCCALAAVIVIAAAFFIVKIASRKNDSQSLPSNIETESNSSDISSSTAEFTAVATHFTETAIAESSVAVFMETQTSPATTVSTESSTLPATTAAPDLPLQGRLIGIDPGHQLKGDSSQEAVSRGSSETKAKVSTGASGYITGRTEESINLEIAFLLRERLEALGAEVVLTRDTSDVNISNQERAMLMNEKGVDACLRIHCNGSDDHAVNGAEMYVKENDPESYSLAELVLSEVCDATGAQRRSVFESNRYTGLNWSDVPSVLVELGFLSNAEEEAKLIDPAYQRLLVDAMASALQKWLGA